jgi:dCMP deaminase
MSKWNERFIGLAKHVALWSKDPSTQVGAVVVDEQHRIVSLGFNGFPRGVEDKPERYLDKPTKYSMVVHAEVNAILTANHPVVGCILYSSLFTCNECAKLVIQSGIKHVVSPKPDKPHWQASFDTAMLMYKEAGVGVTLL